MEETDFDKEILEEIFDNSDRLGNDIESTDFSGTTETFKLSFYLLNLQQPYTEPDNIYVSAWSNPPIH